MATLYRSTVNLPESKLYEERLWPDEPRTAVLFGMGILVPVIRRVLAGGDPNDIGWAAIAAAGSSGADEDELTWESEPEPLAEA
jgi:hypothetical protein